MITAISGTFGRWVTVRVMVIQQAVTPDGMQGRVAATLTCAGRGVSPAGSLLAQAYGSRAGVLVPAAGMLLSSLILTVSPLARLGRALPSTPEREVR